MKTPGRIILQRPSIKICYLSKSLDLKMRDTKLCIKIAATIKKQAQTKYRIESNAIKVQGIWIHWNNIRNHSLNGFEIFFSDPTHKYILAVWEFWMIACGLDFAYCFPYVTSYFIHRTILLKDSWNPCYYKLVRTKTYTLYLFWSIK